LNLPEINWDAISAIASAVATIAALVAIILTIRNNKDSEQEKQFFVQAWFHVSKITRMGPQKTIDLIILNDAVSTIRMDKAFLIVNEKKIELNFKYLKKDDAFKETGKTFVVQIKNDDDLIGKDAYIEIVYTNLYNNQMRAISPIFHFIEKRDVYTRLDIKNEKFLYIPFKNELI
jgi:hypothetical protein